jgi:predicted enzyme related to lactoylglutathione lyase
MVKDMDKSINFYKNIGLELKQRWENNYAQVAAPNVVIGLHPAREITNASNGISIGFGVDSIDEVKDHLQKTGIAYETAEDKVGKYAHLKDPDGTLLYFMESTIEW